MTPDSETAKPSDETPEASANTMDRPLPGSAGAVPNAVASGVAEPIEVAERAAGIDPGTPSPTQAAETDNSAEEKKR